MTTLCQDFRFGLRTLGKNLSVTILAVGSLALAISGNTIVYSLVNGLLYRPLPFAEPHRMAFVGERARDLPSTGLTLSSSANFLDWQERQTSFEAIAGSRSAIFSLDVSEADPHQLVGAELSPEFFPVVRVRAAQGRVFLAEESIPGNHRVAILKHKLWLERFAAQPDILGKILKLNGELYEVVGVLEEGFEFLSPQTEIYVPLALERAELKRPRRDLFAVARLKDGVSDEQAQAEMSAIMEQLTREYPESNRGYVVDVANFRESFPDATSRVLVKTIQWALIFVLLIASANVANLLLARSQSREREMAVRTSIGATRLRLIRQLLTESMTMALVAGLVGVALAVVGVDVMTAELAAVMPKAWLPALDARVLAYTLLVTLLGGLLFGLAPVLRLARSDLLSPIKDGTQASTASGSRRFWSNALVVGELALALIFLAGASVMVNSFQLMQDSDPGFSSDNILTATVALPLSRYSTDEELTAGVEQLQERLAALPGVDGVTVSNSPVRTPFQAFDVFTIDAAPPPGDQSLPRAAWLTTNPGYFKTLGVPLLRGRPLHSTDDADAPAVALVNDAMAKRFWPRTDPVGQRITMLGRSREIVGIVADVRHGLAINTDLTSTAYFPWSQLPHRNVSLALATRMAPEDLVDATRRELVAFEADMAVTELRTLDSLVQQFWVGQQVVTVILVGFGTLALILAALGTYGVLAYSVVQRTHEIGVRMAIGAGHTQVVAMIFRQGSILAALGIGLGIPGVIGVNRLIAATMATFVPVEGSVVIGVAVLLTGVTFLASFVPAQRAARVDPVDALRTE